MTNSQFAIRSSRTNERMNKWMNEYMGPNAWILLKFVYTHTAESPPNSSQIQRNKENPKNEKEPRQFFTILKFQYVSYTATALKNWFRHWIACMGLERGFFHLLLFSLFILHERELSKIEIKIILINKISHNWMIRYSVWLQIQVSGNLIKTEKMLYNMDFPWKWRMS